MTGWLLQGIEIERYRNRFKFDKITPSVYLLRLYLDSHRLVVRSDSGQFQDVVPLYEVSNFVQSDNPDIPTLCKIMWKDPARSKAAITFKVKEIEAFRNLFRIVKGLLENYIEFTELSQLEEEIITQIKETEPAFKYVYGQLEGKFENKAKLKQILFGDNEKIVSYMRLAKIKAFEKEKVRLLEKHMQVEENVSVLEGYGAKKDLLGYRMAEEDAKLTYQKSEVELNEESIISLIPAPQIDGIEMEFARRDIPMDVEPQMIHRVEETQLCRKMEIPKGNFRIFLPKAMQTEIQGRTNVQPQREVDKRELEIIVLMAKIFYRLLRFGGTEHEISLVEAELQFINNSEKFRLVKHVKDFVQKTMKNILQWKRNEYEI